jgi:hypothetical protein
MSGAFAGAAVSGRLSVRDDGILDAEMRVVSGTSGGGGTGPFPPTGGNSSGRLDVSFQLQLEQVWSAED